MCVLQHPHSYVSSDAAGGCWRRVLRIPCFRMRSCGCLFTCLLFTAKGRGLAYEHRMYNLSNPQVPVYVRYGTERAPAS
jgi:hypothetical protein